MHSALIRSNTVRCVYSLEVPHEGTFDELPQHMFSWRNIKEKISIFLVEKSVKALLIIGYHNMFSWRNEKNINTFG